MIGKLNGKAKWFCKECENKLINLVMQNEGVVANNEEVESNERTKECDETESNDISKMWKKIEFNRSILQ